MKAKNINVYDINRGTIVIADNIEDAINIYKDNYRTWDDNIPEVTYAEKKDSAIIRISE